MSEMDNFVEGFSDATKIAERHYKDKIAELEAENQALKTGIKKVSDYNGRLEAKLATAVELLDIVETDIPKDSLRNEVNTFVDANRPPTEA